MHDVNEDDAQEFMLGFVGYSKLKLNIERCIEEGIRTAGTNVNEYGGSGYVTVDNIGDTTQYLYY